MQADAIHLYRAAAITGVIKLLSRCNNFLSIKSVDIKYDTSGCLMRIE